MPENDQIITPQIDAETAAHLKKKTEKLEWWIDTPTTGMKPVGQSGLLEEIGRALWQASGLDVDQILEKIEEAKDDEETCRFLVTGTDHQDLPWELLYHDNPAIGFVARRRHCTVSRCVRYRGEKAKAPQKAARPLRILFLVSSPEGSGKDGRRLDFEKEEELLFTALDESLRKGEVHIDVAEDGSLPTLVRRLEQDRYHALILSMHGTAVKTADGKTEGALLFEDPKTFQKAPVTGNTLAKALGDLPKGRRPAVTVLAACRSARAEETADSISSVARILHDSGIERVLGMRLSVLDKAASIFDAELFRRLALGDELGRAVTLARVKLVEDGNWHGMTREADSKFREDPFAQWTLPVLMDRTTDGPVIDTEQKVDLIPRPPLPSVLMGDGNILLPHRSAFVGRRREIRQHLQPFLDGQQGMLLFTGPGGVGKTALAGLFARFFLELNPHARLMGFQAPFQLTDLFEPLRKAAFDGEEEANLKDALAKEPEIVERLRRLLVSLSKRGKRPFLLVLDNLESFQAIDSLAVENPEIEALLRIVAELPEGVRVLLTGRYTLADLPENRITRCRVGDASYGDILRRMERLRWPEGLEKKRKEEIYKTLGGNHRAIEWMVQLLNRADIKANDLLQKLAAVQAPPRTPEEALAMVKEVLRQNLLFDEVRKQLTPTEDRLLRATALYRAPVNEDGLQVIDPEQETLRKRLLDYSLMEEAWNASRETLYFHVPPVVKNLIGKAGFENAELRRLNEAMGEYHRFMGKYVTKTLDDYLEAIHHFRLSGNHETADELAEGVAKFYYGTSNFAEANRLAGEIVDRKTPPPPWWALNRYGLCQQRFGFYDKALAAHEKSLLVSSTRKEKSATLNSISQVYDAQGDYERALTYLEQSLTILQEIGVRANEAGCLHNMANVALQTGKAEKAIQYWSEALPIAMETGNAELLFQVSGQMGELFVKIGNKEEAKKLLTIAVQVGRQVGFPNVDKFEKLLKEVE